MRMILINRIGLMLCSEKLCQCLDEGVNPEYTYSIKPSSSLICPMSSQVFDNWCYWPSCRNTELMQHHHKSIAIRLLS